MAKKNTLIIWTIGIFILLLIIFGLSIYTSKESVTQTVTTNNTPIQKNIDLPGLQKTEVPWYSEIEHLKERLAAIGLPALSQEGSAVHTHQHLDIFINGKSVSVPSDIGFNKRARFISSIHTHDTSGVIHVESPTVQKFTLGQFFDIWGVQFTENAIGQYLSSATSTIQVYVNGQKFYGNPRNVELNPHAEIVLAYGKPNELPKTIPASYTFPAGE